MASRRKKIKIFSGVCVLVILCGLFWMQGCSHKKVTQLDDRKKAKEQKKPKESVKQEPKTAEAAPEVKPEGPEGYIDDSFGARLARMEIPEKFRLKEIVIGDPKAPKTLIVYFSYTCPHCREFHLKEFPRFKEEYVDKGLIKVIFRNYLDDQGAYEAALVVRCVCKDDTKKYHKLSEAIISKQKDWLSSENPAVFLVNIFNKAEVSENQIKACLKRTDIGAGLMLEQKRAMWELNLDSMPAFINDKGEKHIGSITYEELVKLCGLT